jgi:hypothetical protein
MTYEERQKRLCDNCEAKENCSYISRNLENKCSFRETVMYGWELGYKDAINKSYEWLLNRYYDNGYLDLDDVDELKKYMEE